LIIPELYSIPYKFTGCKPFTTNFTLSYKSFKNMKSSFMSDSK